MSFRFLKSFTNNLRSANDGSNSNHQATTAVVTTNHASNRGGTTIGPSRNKAAPPSAVSGSHSFNNRDRGPGGQILLQRNVQTQPKAQQKAVVTPKNAVVEAQARQEIQGVLSMEEVMKDLRILEEQQRESQRKLHSARMAKQRAERQHSKLETKMGELKFANGQSRALLQRMHEVLEESHIAVTSMRKRVDNADTDLHKFNRALQEALQTKICILSGIKKQQRQLERVQAAVSSLASRREELEKRKKEAETRLDQTVSHKQSLLDGIHKETSKQQKVASEMSELNAVALGMEVALEEKHKSESNCKSQFKQIQNEESELVSRSNEIQSKIEAETNDKRTGCSKLRDDIQKQEQNLKQQESDLETACKNHVEICKTNQVPLLHHETIAPSWDEAAANDLLAAEDKAIKEEEAAKDVLESEQKDLQRLLDSLQQQAAELAKRNYQLKQEEKEARGTEILREQNFQRVLQQLRDEKAETQSLVEKVERMRLLQEQQEAKDRETGRKLAEEMAQLERENNEAADENHELDRQIEEHERQCESERKSKLQRVAAKEADIRRQEERLSRINADAEAMEDSACDEAGIETIQADIARIIEDCPVLASVIVTYNPDKTLEDQARVDLAIIIEDCKKREESAKKLHRERQRAKTQEEKERKKIEKDRELEAQRRERARERRKQRHEDGKPKNGDPGGEKQRHDRDKQERRNIDVQKQSPSLAVKDREVSAAKPRNLLEHFSQANGEDEPLPSEPSSSKKKVRWSEDGSFRRKGPDLHGMLSSTDDKIDGQKPKEADSETHRSRTFGKSHQKHRNSSSSLKAEKLFEQSSTLLENSKAERRQTRPETKEDRLSQRKDDSVMAKCRDSHRSDRHDTNAAKKQTETKSAPSRTSDSLHAAKRKTLSKSGSSHQGTSDLMPRFKDTENISSKEPEAAKRHTETKAATFKGTKNAMIDAVAAKRETETKSASSHRWMSESSHLFRDTEKATKEKAASRTQTAANSGSSFRRKSESSRPSKATKANMRVGRGASDFPSSATEHQDTFEDTKKKRSKPNFDPGNLSRGLARSEEAKHDGFEIDDKATDGSEKYSTKNPRETGQKKNLTSSSTVTGISLGEQKTATSSKKPSRVEPKRTVGTSGCPEAKGIKNSLPLSRKRSRQTDEKPPLEGASKLQRRRKKTQTITQNKSSGLQAFGEDFAFDFHK